MLTFCVFQFAFSLSSASYKNSFTADTSTYEVANDGENQGKEKKRWFE
jgi:hypothetical protein